MYISLDLETTGFDPIKDSIIEFGAVKFNAEGETIATLQFLCNPNIPLPQIITHITNITDEDLKGTPQFEEKIAEIKEFIGDLPIIGHNIQFDTGFLRANEIELNNIEYDTQEMASILLPELPSHSLEVISGKLKLQHAEKHRALDDSIAAMELFLKLVKKFEELEPETLEEIKTLSQKSDWPLANLLKDIKSTGQAEVKEQKTATTAKLESNFQEILDTEENALFETQSSYPELSKDLASKATNNTLISIPQDVFLNIFEDLPESTAKIDAEQNYISLTRFQQLKDQPHFENHEISTIVKTLSWLKKTETGLLRELKLFGLEKSVLQKINISQELKEENSYYQRALEKSQSAATICTHEFLTSSNIEGKELIILDIEGFMQSLRRKNSEFLKLEYVTNPLHALESIFPENQSIKTLIDKCTMLFGLIGILFEKHHDPTSYTLRCVVTNGLTNTKEWQQIRDSVNNLIEQSHELGSIKNDASFSYLHQWKEKLNSLSAIFREPDPQNNFIWIEPDHIQSLMVQKSPYNLKDKLDTILQSAKNYKLVGENIGLEDNAEFIKKLYDLDEGLTLHTNPEQNFNINIIDNLDERDKNALPNFIMSYFENYKNKAALIFNAKKQLQTITLNLSQKNLPIISQVTGSPGKIRALLAQEKEECLLLITPRTWEQLEDYSQISTLLISKLPFDPPSDPELIIQSSKFSDPFNEFQVKRAVLKLRNMISRLGKNTEKTVYILDERIIERNYSKIFLKNLKSLGYKS